MPPRVHYGTYLTAGEVAALRFMGLGGRKHEAPEKIGVAKSTINTQLWYASSRLGTRSAGHAIYTAVLTGQMRIPVAEGVEITEEEKKLLFGLAQGEERPEMAAKYGVTEYRIRKVLHDLYVKLGVQYAPQAVYRGFETGNIQIRKKKK